ncbi:LysR family transcriptional regulator [Clavibacter tessellarius]|uniref:LysR family transcriptional regulator n=1 Tax=Clavibacter tessellarius TaxID=31965 RepID=A0A225CFC7_9MICO|nr:LysR family transcriptional regulator [Clavibacter michiganensis]MBT1635900.1 LysR family transcriptional regulator [Clavibacter michiganensis]OQJ63441.1 LysR family transcriptional regulator [Clavibacter michiganensis subsp. tessellarius]UKF33583.1 LysR family transcriptional regulator [Clavibacter michiganensis subsp. tessellarius]
MKISHQRHFVVAAEVLHHPKAADQLGISRAKLASSIRAVEEHYGKSVFDPQATETRLTKAGRLAYEEALEELAKPSTPPEPPRPPAGGKAKASKGQGRAPVVKGQPKPYKRTQGR